MRTLFTTRGICLGCAVPIILCHRGAAGMDAESRRKADFFKFPQEVEERLANADEQQRQEVVREVLYWIGMPERDLLSARTRLLCEIDRYSLKEGIPFLEYTLVWSRRGFWFQEQVLAARIYLRLKTNSMTPKERTEFLLGTFLPNYPFEIQEEALKMLEGEGEEARARLLETICHTSTEEYSSFDEIRPLLWARGMARSNVLAPADADISRMAASPSPVANVLALEALHERFADLVKANRFEDASQAERILDTMALKLVAEPSVERLGMLQGVASCVRAASLPRLFEIMSTDGFSDSEIEIVRDRLERLHEDPGGELKRIPRQGVPKLVRHLRELASLEIDAPRWEKPRDCRIVFLRVRARKLAVDALAAIDEFWAARDGVAAKRGVQELQRNPDGDAENVEDPPAEDVAPEHAAEPTPASDGHDTWLLVVVGVLSAMAGSVATVAIVLRRGRHAQDASA